jgi:hypothetical protein
LLLHGMDDSALASQLDVSLWADIAALHAEVAKSGKVPPPMQLHTRFIAYDTGQREDALEDLRRGRLPPKRWCDWSGHVLAFEGVLPGGPVTITSSLGFPRMTRTLNYKGRSVALTRSGAHVAPKAPRSLVRNGMFTDAEYRAIMPHVGEAYLVDPWGFLQDMDVDDHDEEAPYMGTVWEEPLWDMHNQVMRQLKSRSVDERRFWKVLTAARAKGWHPDTGCSPEALLPAVACCPPWDWSPRAVRKLAMLLRAGADPNLGLVRVPATAPVRGPYTPPHGFPSWLALLLLAGARASEDAYVFSNGTVCVATLGSSNWGPRLVGWPGLAPPNERWTGARAAWGTQ